MAAVGLSGVRKRFGDAEALRGVDAHIDEGEFVVLVGPSGSGKTTLLRIVAGLERADAGQVTLDGRVVNDVPPKDRDIAMVFQQYALYPHLDVRENLAFSLRMRDAPRALVDERVRQAAALLGLQSYLGRYPSQLSGGQQQRVAIGRAIVRKPRLFLFDEPLSNLDGALRTQLRIEIRGLHRRLGATALYVTHDQAEAMALADRIVVLRDGRVEQAGTPLELYDRPANLFVAGFIGLPAMNLVPAALLGDPRPHVIGFRPDACVLGPPDDHGLPARVMNVEHMGPAQHVYLELPGATLCAAVPGRTPWQAGQAVSVQPDAARLLRFDAATGRALNPGAH